jgi:hypothetical protein
MFYVACPSCGERGKIPPTLVGARIKCRKCGLSFNVSPPTPKAIDAAAASVPAVSETTGTPHAGIVVEGLDPAAWSITGDQCGEEKAEREHDLENVQGERTEASPEFVPPESVGAKEYKLLTSKDKIFDGKFDLGRLEEALNYYARQGWVVRAMSTPRVKGFGGGMVEEIVVLLER